MGKSNKDFDLRKLEIFYWVAEMKSFSLAAQQLSLRQPTVSAHIRELEEAVGGKILDRLGGEATPTALGALLLERAKGLLAFKKDTLAALDRFRGKISGDLLIGGSNIPGEYILPKKLGHFIHLHPDVKPVLRIGDSAGIVQAVLEGEVELGFVGFRGEDGRLSFQKIWKDEMVLAVPKAHQWSSTRGVDLAELGNEPFISREGGSGTLRSFRKLIARKRREPERLLNVVMELGSTESIKEALIAGLGVSILSKTSIRRELQDGLLKEIPIRGLKLERDFYQIHHRRKALSPVSHAFVQFLRHH